MTDEQYYEMAQRLDSLKPFSQFGLTIPRIKAARKYDGGVFYLANIAPNHDADADGYQNWHVLGDEHRALLDAAAEDLKPELDAIDAGWVRVRDLDVVFAASRELQRVFGQPRELSVALFRSEADRDRWLGKSNLYAAHSLSEHELDAVRDWLVQPPGWGGNPIKGIVR